MTYPHARLIKQAGYEDALNLENMFNEPIKAFEVPVTVQCQHY
jgi:hypothetical protein